MPEVLGDPPSPRTALFWNGTAWQWALVDAAGQLQVDVIASGLPLGAATAANQVTMITALQLIDDLRNALQSVGTDRIQVQGEDQLLSIDDVYIEQVFDLNAAVGANTLTGSGVPAGSYRIITQMAAYNTVSATTDIYLTATHNGTAMRVRHVQTLIVNQTADWQGMIVLDVDDVVSATLAGCVAGDDIYFDVFGYVMTIG